MRKLSSFLNEKYIKLNIKANTKSGMILELAELVKDEVTDFQKFCDEILERESVGSTALENGLAIPHVRSNYLKDFAVVVGTKPEGIDCESLDDKKSTLFFLIATNRQYNDYHLQTLASIVKMFDNATKVKILSNTHSKEGFVGLIEKLEEIS